MEKSVPVSYLSLLFTVYCFIVPVDLILGEGGGGGGEGEVRAGCAPGGTPGHPSGGTPATCPGRILPFSSIITLQPILLPFYFTQNLPFSYYALFHFIFLHTQTAQTTSTSTSSLPMYRMCSGRYSRASSGRYSQGSSGRYSWRYCKR